MKLFEIFGNINIKEDSAVRALGRVDSEAKTLSDKINTLGGKLNTLGGKLTGAGGKMTKWVTGPMVAVGTGLFAATNKTAEYGDAIHKTSQKVGLSTDSFQELSYWAGQNGISQGSMERATGRLNQRMGMAREGNEKYSEAMKNLGVDMEALENGTLSTEEAFEQAMVGLSEMTNEQDKAAAASELFGTKLARDLMPALGDGSMTIEEAKIKAEELGLVMSEDAVNSAAAFQDSMDDLKQQLGGVFREMGEKLMPIITEDLIPMIQDKLIPILEDLIGKVVSVIEWFSDLPPGVQTFITISGLLLTALGPLLMVIGSIASGIGTVMTAFSKLSGLFSILKVAGGALISALGAISAPVWIVIGIVAALIAIGVALWKNWDKVKEMAGKFKDGLVNVWNIIKEKTAEIFNAVKDLIIGAFEFVRDKVKEVVDKFREVLVNVWETIKEKTSEAFNAVRDLIVGTFEAVRDKVKEIATKFKDGLLNIWNTIKDKTVGTFNNVRDAIIGPIERARDKVKEIVEKIKGFFDFKLELPEVGLPKFLGGDGLLQFNNDEEGGKKKRKRRFFAKGGYMSRPTEFARNNRTSFIGGEAGGEGIVPLQGKHMRPMAAEMAQMLRDYQRAEAQTKNEFNIASLVVREEADVERIAEKLEVLIARKNKLRGAY